MASLRTSPHIAVISSAPNPEESWSETDATSDDAHRSQCTATPRANFMYVKTMFNHAAESMNIQVQLRDGRVDHAIRPDASLKRSREDEGPMSCHDVKPDDFRSLVQLRGEV